MTTGLAFDEGFFRCGVFEGCITSSDVEISRRPYHRNCNCPLHKVSEKYCPQSSSITNTSYRIGRCEGSTITLKGSSTSLFPAHTAKKACGNRWLCVGSFESNHEF